MTLRPPAAPLRKHLRDSLWLLRGELLILRETWFWYLVQASFVPISYLLFLRLLTAKHDPHTMSIFLTGSLVMGLSFGGMASLGQNLGFLKDQNAFEYYASLPISRTVFILAIATRGMLLTLPSALTILMLGHFTFSLSIPWITFPILVLSAYAMCGMGMVIGFWSPTARVASLVTQILQTVIVLLAPIYYPVSSLPWPLRLASYLWPTSYAAEALRAVMRGASAATVGSSLLVLAGFAAASLVLVPLRLSWRSG